MKKNARVWSMDDYNAHTHAHALHFTSWRDSLVVFYCISAKKKKKARSRREKHKFPILYLGT